MTDIHLIPMDKIDDAALPRDRSVIDPDAERELANSIFLSTLRFPIEVFRMPEPAKPHEYGLISGLRRLGACRLLHADYGAPNTIAAFIRTPKDLSTAVTAMVEENAIRAEITPWDQGRVALTAAEKEIFTSTEDAVRTLFPHASRIKRHRICAIAMVVRELEDILKEPQSLNQNQLLRIAAAINRDMLEVIRLALKDPCVLTAGHQWTVMEPYLR